MTIWKNSTMTTFYYSSNAEDIPCIVKIDDKTILVEYEDEGVVQYKGRNNNDGHFELTAPQANGRASLHQFPNGEVLEGYWSEDGNRGMWRISLG